MFLLYQLFLFILKFKKFLYIITQVYVSNIIFLTHNILIKFIIKIMINLLKYIYKILLHFQKKLLNHLNNHY